MVPILALCVARAAVGAYDVGVTAGAYAAGRELATERPVDPFAVLALDARFRPEPAGRFADRLVLDASFAGLVPAGTYAAGELVAVARAGLALGDFMVSLGAHVRRADTDVAPWQLFPALAVSWRRQALEVFLGVLDRAYGPVARLGVAYGPVGIAYVPALGLEAFGRLPLTPSLALECDVFAQAVLGARVGGATLGVRWSSPALERP